MRVNFNKIEPEGNYLMDEKIILAKTKRVTVFISTTLKSTINPVSKY